MGSEVQGLSPVEIHWPNTMAKLKIQEQKTIATKKFRKEFLTLWILVYNISIELNPEGMIKEMSIFCFHLEN